MCIDFIGNHSVTLQLLLLPRGIDIAFLGPAYRVAYVNRTTGCRCIIDKLRYSYTIKNKKKHFFQRVFFHAQVRGEILLAYDELFRARGVPLDIFAGRSQT